MELNDLLRENNIDPAAVLVLRHSPKERDLQKVFPNLARARPDLFNAYQSVQNPKTEMQMVRADYVASFISQPESRALFVAIYVKKGEIFITDEEWFALPEAQELIRFGMSSAPDTRPQYRYFQLEQTDILQAWSGRLIVDWPPPSINWSRWARGNRYPIHAVAEDDKLFPKIPAWDELSLTFATMALYQSWGSEIRRWRGVYYIFDRSLNKGYVGAAYGKENIWGRWQTHLKYGGDAVRLKQCDPANFVFTILALTSPTAADVEVIALEKSWKKRLHTIDCGLNDN